MNPHENKMRFFDNYAKHLPSEWVTWAKESVSPNDAIELAHRRFREGCSLEEVKKEFNNIVAFSTRKVYGPDHPGAAK